MINKNFKFVNNWVIIATLIIIAIIGGLIYYSYYFKTDNIDYLSGEIENGNVVAAPVVEEYDIKEGLYEKQTSAIEKRKEPRPGDVVVKLSADKGEYKLNDLINVNVLLSLSDKKTPETSVLLQYDPKSLEIQKTSGGTLKTSGKADNPLQIIRTTDSSFTTFPYLTADILKGSIFFSALTPARENVTGEASVASLIFKAIKKGTTKINLVFDKNFHQDTGVYYLGDDILNTVVDTEIIVN